MFSNNLFGEVQWKAQGVSGGTVTDCDNGAHANHKIHLTCDNMGDLWKVNYPDNDIVTAPEIIYTRGKNGNVTIIQVGTITRLYNYNILGLSRQLPESIKTRAKRKMVLHGRG